MSRIRVVARVSLPVLLLAIVPGTALRAQDAGAPDPVAARQMFERFASLAGDWRTRSTVGWDGASTYRLIARGSVVMGTTDFPDAPDRTMVTMFHLDGDRLVLTHYCEARNQPHLVADRIDVEAGEVVFRFAGGTNLPDRDHGHMDTAVYTFRPDGSLVSRWTWYQNGEERWLEDIEAVRIR